MTETIFFNFWQTDSRENQDALVAEMRSEATAFRGKPGFLGLTVWTGQDNHRVIVEGRWRSQADFDAAVSENPEAVASRARLEKFGKAEPGVFSESIRIEPAGSETAIPPGEGVTFMQVWEVGTSEHQRGWLTTMRENAGALTGKSGFSSMRTHASEDSKRVAVYAQWRDRASLEAAVATPEAKAGHQALRAHGMPDGNVYKVADVFLPDRSEALFEDVSRRWAELGLKSRTIGVKSVDLHVVSGGTGSPLVLLHGYPQSGEIWRFVAPELTKTHHVIVPDLRGMGLSGIAASGYDLPNVADDLHQLIAHLGLRQVAIAGHDWGAAVGAVWSLRHRGDVSKFAFVESAVGGAGFESIWTFNQPNPAMTFIPFLLSEPLAETLTVGREETFMHYLWNTFTHNKDRVPFAAWKPYVDAMKRPGLVRSSASYYRSVYATVGRVRELIDTGKLTIPVLSISGDASLGRAQKSFVEAFASNIVKHVVVPNCGHFVAEEQPEALTGELRAFFDE